MMMICIFVLFAHTNRICGPKVMKLSCVVLLAHKSWIRGPKTLAQYTKEIILSVVWS